MACLLLERIIFTRSVRFCSDQELDHVYISSLDSYMFSSGLRFVYTADIDCYQHFQQGALALSSLPCCEQCFADRVKTHGHVSKTSTTDPIMSPFSSWNGFPCAFF